MKMDILDIPKFIGLNELKEVTNPITLRGGTEPTPDGLLSYEIFGRDSYSRKEIFAYIKLNKKVLHPYIYKQFKKMFRKIDGVINQTVYIKIVKGELVETTEKDGGTGIDFIYKHFDAIKFKSTSSLIRKVRVDLFNSINRNEAFIDRLIVIPPFYRDVNTQSQNKIGIGEVNGLYSKILRLSKSYDDDDLFMMMTASLDLEMQRQLEAIYDFFIDDNIKGKNGLFRSAVLGKSVDYGSRLVISQYKFRWSKNVETDEMVGLERSMIPLQHIVSDFSLYILHYLKEFFTRGIVNRDDIGTVIDGKIQYEELDNPKAYFNEKFIIDAMKRFIKSPHTRFDTIQAPLKDGRMVDLKIKSATYDKSEDKGSLPRPMTWTDLFYIAAVDVTKDKHVVLTRYPVTGQFSEVVTKISVGSTIETEPRLVHGKFYRHYPVIPLDPKDSTKIDKTANPATCFHNTLCISNLHTGGLGADYDGDQMSVKPVYSQEANIEAHEFIYSARNLLNIEGGNERTSSNELILTLAMLTRPPIE